MTLKESKIGQQVLIKAVAGEGPTRQHLLDMGVIPGNLAKIIKFAPMGDPVEIEVTGYALTLSLSQTALIQVEPSPQSQSLSQKAKPAEHISPVAHPGLGEEGKYHVQNEIPVIPAGAPLHFGLVGNQNTGKTTLFNTLTGSNQHVGNFPGVTVERKEGTVKCKSEVTVIDLPGIYSLSPYSPEEIVSRNFILDTKTDGIIDIVDATNIERNLYLTMQLLELDIPVVVALNMMDEVTQNGGSIMVNALEEKLGVPVVPVNALNGEGIEELMRHIVHVSRHHEGPLKKDFCDKDEDGGAVHRALHSIMHLIADHAQSAHIPPRFAASKLIEGDKLVRQSLKLDQNELDAIEHIVVQMEKERALDRGAAIADMRFDFIRKVCAATVIKPQASKEKEQSLAIDKVLTGKYTAIPVFVAIMAVVFFLTFNVIGAAGQTALEILFDNLSATLSSFFENANAPAIVSSFVVDGILAGVGSVVSFLPIILTLFFFLSMLEDLGYMARIAFVMDKPLRKVGLSGRSIVPLLVGFGCTVPAVMAARTLPSDRDRKLTILLTPFMSCSAKLPVYAFFSEAFFPQHAAAIMLALYLLGIALGIVAALIYGKTKFRGAAVPFVMELPNYRIPSAKNIGLLLWEKIKDFLARAFTVILAATIVVWFLQTFNSHLEITASNEDSLLRNLASLISPVFAPLGFADWRVVSSLITGFLAKETVVATITVLFGSVDILLAALTTRAAVCLLVFCLLYTPCIAACSVIKKEMGIRWGAFVTVGQSVIAYFVALLVNLVAGFFC